MRKLELIFSHSFEGKLWNMVSEPSGNYLLLEIRNADTLSASFYIYDRKDASLQLKPISFEENWWIGISYFTDKLIVFHVFPETDDPAVKTFFCYDIVHHRTLWKMEQIDILSFSEHSMKVITKGETQVRQFDLFSGKIQPESLENRTQPDTNFIRYPFHYVQGTAHFETVEKFLSSIDIGPVERGVDYFEGNGVVVIAYYTGGTKLVNDLIVIDLNKNILLNERLGKELGGISDRAFFVFHDTLIFVKDTTHFFCYQLPKK